MTTSRLVVAAACAAALASVPALAEDLTIVYKTTTPNGSGTSTSYYSSEKMRTGDGERDTIIEYGPGRIVSIDHKKKEYSEYTLAEMEASMKAASAKMEQANAQMKQQMANMPPALREKMEGMMGGGAAAVTVTKGTTRKVAGYDCQNYDVKMGTAMEMHVCASTAVTPPTPNVDPRTYASVAGPAATFASNPMFKGAAKLAEEMKKIQGFVLADATNAKVMGRSFDTTKEATEVKRGAIPAAAFDVATIAKGYKKVDSPMAKLPK
jgi:hypothetical protein